MVRFLCRQSYCGHVIYGNAPSAEVELISFDCGSGGDTTRLEQWLRYSDCPNMRKPEYTVRELVGVELLPLSVSA